MAIRPPWRVIDAVVETTDMVSTFRATVRTLPVRSAPIVPNVPSFRHRMRVDQSDCETDEQGRPLPPASVHGKVPAASAGGRPLPYMQLFPYRVHSVGKSATGQGRTSDVLRHAPSQEQPAPARAQLPSARHGLRHHRHLVPSGAFWQHRRRQSAADSRRCHGDPAVGRNSPPVPERNPRCFRAHAGSPAWHRDDDRRWSPATINREDRALVQGRHTRLMASRGEETRVAATRRVMQIGPGCPDSAARRMEGAHSGAWLNS